MTFVDASALVAIILEESGFQAIEDRLHLAEVPTTSAIAIWETVRAVSRENAAQLPASKTLCASTWQA